MSERVVVRKAEVGDVAAAVELWTLSHVARRNGRPLPDAHVVLARQRMASPDSLLLLAHTSEDDDHDVGPEPTPSPAPIGTILAVQGLDQDGAGPPVPGLLHISLLSVAPDRWGRHVGRRLVEAVLTRGAADGFDEAQLWTHADNLRANRLYKAMGFRRSGRVRVDDWGELLVHYRRPLT
ncbi:GNAT family N-acetyltransferase [Streptacidiphilus cavernicola]|uniref:GNAT family N-acetyltransferase n=1 Tax=Streptacidiphilus cavernicola TaxID=3342716 RepID=A0ABV6VU32_9ACTN